MLVCFNMVKFRFPTVGRAGIDANGFPASILLPGVPSTWDVKKFSCFFLFFFPPNLTTGAAIHNNIMNLFNI